VISLLLTVIADDVLDILRTLKSLINLISFNDLDPLIKSAFKDSIITDYMDTPFTIIFAIDILLNFNVVVTNEDGTLITDRCDIAI